MMMRSLCITTSVFVAGLILGAIITSKLDSHYVIEPLARDLLAKEARQFCLEKDTLDRLLAICELMEKCETREDIERNRKEFREYVEELRKQAESAGKLSRCLVENTGSSQSDDSSSETKATTNVSQ